MIQYDSKTKFYDIMLNENCTLDCTFCCLGKKSHKIIDINKLLSIIELDNISIHIAGEPLASIKSSKTLYHLLKLLQNVQEKEVKNQTMTEQTKMMVPALLINDQTFSATSRVT